MGTSRWTADDLELGQLAYEIATEGYDVPQWAVLGSAKRERWIRAAVAVAHRDRAIRAEATVLTTRDEVTP